MSVCNVVQLDLNLRGTLSVSEGRRSPFLFSKFHLQAFDPTVSVWGEDHHSL